MTQQPISDDLSSFRPSSVTSPTDNPGMAEKMRFDINQQRLMIQSKSVDIENYRAMMIELQQNLATLDKDFVEVQADLTKVTALEAKEVAELTEEEKTLVGRRKTMETMRKNLRASHQTTTRDLNSATKTMERMEKEYTAMHADYQTKLRWTTEMLAHQGDRDVVMTDLTGTMPSSTPVPVTMANSVALKKGQKKVTIPTEIVGNLEVPTMEQQDLIYRSPQLIMKDIVAMLQFPVSIEVSILNIESQQ